MLVPYCSIYGTERLPTRSIIYILDGTPNGTRSIDTTEYTTVNTTRTGKPRKKRVL